MQNLGMQSFRKLFLMFAWGLSLAVFSQSAFAEKIGYVDARRLVDESPQGEAQLKALEEEFSARNREIKGKFEIYRAAEADFQKNGLLLSPEEQEAKKAELAQMQRELKRDQRDYNEEYGAKRNAGLGTLQKVISDAVIFIAERDKYDLIVQEAVFASKAINLTDTVLEELKSRAKK
ncbi:MAG: OmpH family outer membrane protein [Acidiferrobacterales bacterium]|nr:OmpH family outer membrane protein [Acidiferrobacterales bacterium]